jgi:hypothetical protein
VKEIKMEEGDVFSSFDKIEDATFKHFEILHFEIGPACTTSQIQILAHIPPIVIPEDNQFLTYLVSEDKIWKTILQFDPEKALGSDGFMGHLYKKKHWHIIKFDLVRMIQYIHKFRMIQYIHKSSRMGGAINSTFLALILKEENATSFSRLMPIYLCNISYNIIANIIKNKLNLLLHKLIVSNQGGYVNNVRIFRHLGDS